MSENINEFIVQFNQGMVEMFEKPTVKRAQSIVGKMGGDAKTVGILKEKMAKGFIDKNYGVLKMVGEQVLGINVDEMIEEYGSENILTAIEQITGQLGIDPQQFLADLGNQGSSSNRPHPFMKR